MEWSDPLTSAKFSMIPNTLTTTDPMPKHTQTPTIQPSQSPPLSPTPQTYTSTFHSSESHDAPLPCDVIQHILTTLEPPHFYLVSQINHSFQQGAHSLMHTKYVRFQSHQRTANAFFIWKEISVDTLTWSVRIYENPTLHISTLAHLHYKMEALHHTTVVSQM
jgi:hypothetical protein